MKLAGGRGEALPGSSPDSACRASRMRERRRGAMRRKELMTPEVEGISPEATLQQTAVNRRRLHSGPFLACEGDPLGGMLTEQWRGPTCATCRFSAATPDSLAWCHWLTWR